MATAEELKAIGFIDAPQPTQEQQLALYKTYRQVGGGTLQLCEELLVDEDNQSSIENT
jgi:hypothetical protein